jgi:cell division protein FtsZ
MGKIQNKSLEIFAKIKVVGIGGGGGNILSRMNRNQMKGVEFVAINTDVQDLHNTGIRQKVHIGKNVSKGLGAGMDPEIGRRSAEESEAQIEEALKGADMIFLTAGLGGGTGSGAILKISDITNKLGILTVAVVTKPFSFEGSRRMQIAEDSLSKLKDKVDAFIVVPNDRIFNVISKDTSIEDAFIEVDNILSQAVKGIAELINVSGNVNTDFADIKTILKGAGLALIGVGSASGENRAIKAVKSAIQSPLFEVSPQGARGVILSLIGNKNITLVELNEVAKMVKEMIHPDAKFIFGTMDDPKVKKGEIRVLVVAAGFGDYRPEKQQTFFNDNKEIKEEKEEEESSFDIPAFLRKKK